MTKKKKSDEEWRTLTFYLLYYWGKLIGINPLSLSENNDIEFSYYSLLYGCSLGTIYCYIFFIVLVERSKLLMTGETPITIIVDYIGIIFHFVETSVTCWYVCAIRQNRIRRLVESLVQAEKISRELGIREDYDKIIWEFGIWVTVNTFLYAISLAASTTLATIHPTFNYLPWALFNGFRIASFNMGMLFIWCLLIVKRKFQRLNEKVRFLIYNDHFQVNMKNSMSSVILTRGQSFHEHLLSARITMVSKLHRELRDLISLIEEHFTPLILFNFMNHLASITLSVYRCYRYFVVSGKITGIESMLQLGVDNHWIIYGIFITIVISFVSGSTSEEANNTGNALHALLNDCDNDPNARKFTILSLDLLQNQVNISLCGFFVMNDFFICGTITTVVMFLTIMLQFDTQ